MPSELVERIYIREAAELLNRRMATLRKWEQLDALPEHLRSHRGNRGWRYWTEEQIEGIREWLRETDRRPGKGLPHYNPTELQLDKAISAMRRPRVVKSSRGSASVAELPDDIGKGKGDLNPEPKKPRELGPPPRPPRRATRPGT